VIKMFYHFDLTGKQRDVFRTLTAGIVQVIGLISQPVPLIGLGLSLIGLISR